MNKKVFLACPVNNVTKEEKEFLDSYVKSLEAKGYKVYYPHRDTEQSDPSGGYQILVDSCNAVKNADQVHVFWNSKSRGSYFDVGTSFSEHLLRGLPIKLVNRKAVEAMVAQQQKNNVKKSFEQVLLKLDSMS
ncbi:hypothetical protein GOV04_00055 [Candidatus Woesearchaeota archaeon]|nr:hypothetical protein [Candidatus Woesearchaeota archaeon]